MSDQVLARAGQMAQFVVVAAVTGLLGLRTAGAHETSKVNTEDAPPVDPGVVEVELNYSYGRAERTYDSGGDANGRRKAESHTVSSKITYGLIEDLDIAGTVSHVTLLDRESDPSRGNGIGDLSIFAKWRFLSLDETLEASYLPGFTAPVGEESSSSSLGPSQEFWSIDQLIALTLTNDPYHVSFDTGYSLPAGEDREENRGTFVADLAFGYQLTKWFQPEIELNYGHGFFSRGPDSDFLAVTIGAIFNLDRQEAHPHGIRLDLGFQHPVFGNNADQTMTALVNLSVAF